MSSKRDSAAQRHDFAIGELESGRPAAAVEALKQAVALDPDRVTAYHDLGNALLELGQVADAEAAYRAALAIEPGYAAVRQSLGDVLRRQGRLVEACESFGQAMLINPLLNRSRLELARTLEQRGEWAAAAHYFQEAVAHSRTPAAIELELGAVLWRQGDASLALAAFERAVAADSNSEAAYYNLASAQLELQHFDAAIRNARLALDLQPGWADALILQAAALAATGALEAAVEALPEAPLAQRYLLLGTRLMGSRLFDAARACLERVLQHEPSQAQAAHLLAALRGDNPQHPVAGYVRNLFDASAATFDQELQSKLGYTIPREMAQALPTPDHSWDVLDLGCGTGLVAVEIAPTSRRLVGVDLAPNMIKLAGERALYTELRCMDLMDSLAADAAQGVMYDVVTAADVFIYVGKLDDVIPAIRRVLRPGGLLAFSAEAIEPVSDRAREDYHLGRMGRYAHGAAYLRRLAACHDFVVERLDPTRIRFEQRRPVQGWLTVWRRSDA